jgi:predicted NBD/HSP70 family sugar kinase
LNDGDVTALAASMSLEKNAIIGMAMGTSVAGGFCDPQGNLTNWLNELAFVPVDFRPSGPVDEWSGDEGCGVQYFSQQGACRLLPAVGIHLPADMKFPEQLVELQKLMAAGDARAKKVYEALGIEFGYTLAHFAEFYDYSSLLIMGRVTSGPGGQIMIDKATTVLKDEFPELNIEVIQPSEQVRPIPAERVRTVRCLLWQHILPCSFRTSGTARRSRQVRCPRCRVDEACIHLRACTKHELLCVKR